jgi:hypothetical protein
MEHHMTRSMERRNLAQATSPPSPTGLSKLAREHGIHIVRMTQTLPPVLAQGPIGSRTR